ncbi:hypothetical protein CDD81_1508 [Ophiocordyceps australis]|uniref:NAD-dependent epimerase/dehydratase domain-containing protein n=1 Tax=Ophiocordyceps australis TaxID=1399860 RepID=A0A2C5YFY4_9HYPO|nr:hypothetical protein CDD81_1508 [Ophiocordyceps australis]
MASSVNGKYALVTGAGSGNNLEFTKLLLENGCSVMMADLKLNAEAVALLDTYAPHAGEDTNGGRTEINGHRRPTAHFHKTDVTSWPQLSALWEATLAAFPSINIVVPGAGVFEPPSVSFWQAPKSETNPDSVSRDAADSDPGHYRLIDVNLVAPIRLSQLAIGYWTQKKDRTPGDANLVLFGSIAARIAALATPLYIASKHAIVAFARSLGALRDTVGIRVGCVAPGPVATAIFEGFEKAAEDAEMIPIHQVADAMMQLVVNDAYGDGTILQVTPGKTYVVPLYNAPPIGEADLKMPGLGAINDQVIHNLRTKGLQV